MSSATVKTKSLRMLSFASLRLFRETFFSGESSRSPKYFLGFPQRRRDAKESTMRTKCRNPALCMGSRHFDCPTGFSIDRSFARTIQTVAHAHSSQPRRMLMPDQDVRAWVHPATTARSLSAMPFGCFAPGLPLLNCGFVDSLVLR